MEATTIGLGPFKPAIRWNDRLFIVNKLYDDEDKARAFAKQITDKIECDILETLNIRGFRTSVAHPR